MKIIKPDISFIEYEKIFRILHAVEGYVGRGSRPDCQFYNIIGSCILSEVYKITAYPVAGAALIKVSNDNDHILGFANTESGFIESDSSHFHCWIETTNHYIDFVSPFYNDYPNAPKSEKHLMFQKPIESMNKSPDKFKKAGDFFFMGDPELTRMQISKYTQSNTFKDAKYLAKTWAEESKRKLKQKTWVLTEDGVRVELPISKIELKGSW